MINYNVIDTNELGDLFSDYHKDVHGFRPRYVDMNDREAIIAALKRLDEYMEWSKSTPEGRNRLREAGWVVKEFEKEDGWNQEAFDREYEETIARYEREHA